MPPTQKDDWLNRVVHFAHPRETVEAAIDEILHELTRADVPFKWIVGPGSAPADLAARLERCGLVRTRARGMVCEPPTLDVRPPANVEVRRVEGDDIDALVETLARGFAEPLDGLRCARACACARAYPCLTPDERPGMQVR